MPIRIINQIFIHIMEGNMTDQQNVRTPSPISITPPNSVNINTLGYFLDGWADLVEGMGEKAKEVRDNVLISIKDRDMPQVRIEDKEGYVSLISAENRPYTLTSTDPGATTTIYVGKHGKDLYVSWRTFILPVLNKSVIFVIFVISVFLGLFTLGIIRLPAGLFTDSQTTFSLIGWIVGTMIFSILGFGIVAIAGKFWKGSFLAFFFIEPSVFDAEDITAMSLAVHKTILRSLDNAGIDVSKLRLKPNFKGGRRDEMV